MGIVEKKNNISKIFISLKVPIMSTKFLQRNKISIEREQINYFKIDIKGISWEDWAMVETR